MLIWRRDAYLLVQELLRGKDMFVSEARPNTCAAREALFRTVGRMGLIPKRGGSFETQMLLIQLKKLLL